MSSRVTSDGPLRLATWLAATLGAFDPAELLARVTKNRGEWRSVATDLAARCTEITSSAATKWRLSGDARRSALLEMQHTGLFEPRKFAAFRDMLRPEPLDRFGQYIRDALVGAIADPSSQHEDLNALQSAYEFVSRARVGIDPDRARNSAGAIERWALQAAAEQELSQAIGPAFVGRRRELKILRQFARPASTGRQTIGRGDDDIPVLQISGIGGSGKSALIARLVSEVRSTGPAAAAVLLDFDRPALSAFDTVDLTRQLIQELSFTLTSLTADLQRLRRDARSELTRDEIADGSPNVYAYSSRAQFILYEQLALLLNKPKDDEDPDPRPGVERLPILIVVDTFEEVLTRGPRFTDLLFGWVRDLRSTVGLQNIRLILSGRATTADLEATEDGAGAPSSKVPGGFALAQTLMLGDLSQEEAERSLRQREVPRDIAQDLVKVFGCNPLVLRLLGDYGAQEGPQRLRELIDEPRSQKRYRNEIAQRILYSRILDRIRTDPAVRALASPGLVVRIVTPGIVQHVLAEPCGLGPIDAARASDLLEGLARHVWLVRRVNERLIRHRRDIRSLMLPLVTEPRSSESKAVLVDSVRQIHERALEYHSKVDDPDLPTGWSANEALYHDVMLHPSSLFESSKVSSAALASLMADVTDFPLRTQARIKNLHGHALSREELSALSRTERQRYESQQDSLALEKAGPTRVSIYSSASPTGRFQFRRLPRSAAQLVVAFAEGRFTEVAESCPQAILTFFEQLPKKSVSTIWEEVSRQHLWLAGLATFVKSEVDRGPREPSPFMKDFLGLLHTHWDGLASMRLSDDSGFSVADYLAAVYILLAHNRGFGGDIGFIMQRAGLGERSFSITSNLSLRIFQMFEVGRRRHKIQASLRPSYVLAAHLQYFAALTDGNEAPSTVRTTHFTRKAWQANALRDSRLRQELYWARSYEPHTMSVSTLTGIESSIANLRIDISDWLKERVSFRNYWSTGPQLNLRSLRGMTPELQTPALVALRECMSDPQIRRRLPEAMARMSSAWPYDLMGDRRVNDGYLTTMSHLADRFGMFRDLFQFSRRESVGARIARILDRYDEILFGNPFSMTRRIKG